MPVTTLNWRALAPVTLAANTVNAALDAMYTAGTAATYADGSARTPGTDCAWTWNRDTTNPLQAGATTAGYAFPPTTFVGVPNPGVVIPQVVMWCGSNNAPTNMRQYTFPAGQTDARTATMLYAGMVKNPGAYADWNAANPFTTGDCTGFARAFVLPATATWNALYMWECQEAVLVTFARTSPQINTSWSAAGALGDPGFDALGETDGRIYGVMTSGSNNYNQPAFWSNVGDAAFYEAGVAGQSRFGCFIPGTANVAGYTRFGLFTTTTSLLSRGSEVPLIPFYANGTLTGNAPSPIRLREIFISRDGTTANAFTNGPTVLGYVVGAYFSTTAADVAVLTR